MPFLLFLLFWFKVKCHILSLIKCEYLLHHFEWPWWRWQLTSFVTSKINLATLPKGSFKSTKNQWGVRGRRVLYSFLVPGYFDGFGEATSSKMKMGKMERSQDGITCQASGWGYDQQSYTTAAYLMMKTNTDDILPSIKSGMKLK